MPGSNSIPDIRTQLADLEQRVANLERGVTAVDGRSTKEIVFSYPGPLAIAESPPIRSRYSHTLVTVAFVLGTAGTTNTVIEVRTNGTAVRTLTILAGWTTFNGVVDVDVGADQDVLTLAITTVGDGAADLTAQARFS